MGRQTRREAMREEFNSRTSQVGLSESEKMLFAKCAVRRTSGERKLWPEFSILKQELEKIDDNTKEYREHKVHRLRQIAGSANMTTAEAILQYKQWPKRQSMCDRRRLDRVLNTCANKKLSAWRKFLRGKWSKRNAGETNDEFIIAGGSNDRVSLWRINP